MEKTEPKTCLADEARRKLFFRRDGQPRQPQTVLRDLISWDYGYRLVPRKPGVKPKYPRCNSKEKALALFQSGSAPAKPNNFQLSQHWGDNETYFFTSTGRCRDAFVLFMVDIDCHGGDSRYEDALALEADLKRDFGWETLFTEDSTSGTGRHGYLLVYKGFTDAEVVVKRAKELQEVLREYLAGWLARNPGRHVDDIEVKGSPPVVHYLNDRPTRITCGQLGKIPRTLRDRWLEFQATTTICLQDIEELEVPGPVEVEVSRGERRGSVAGHPISQENLDRLEAYYGFLRGEEYTPQKTKGREVATLRDAGIFLLILEYCTADPNKDGTLPVSRVRSIWEGLREEDVIDRAYCHRRFVAVRDWLTAKGFISWVDANYVPPLRGEKGEVLEKGRACKWSLTEEVMEKLEEEKKEYYVEEERENLIVTSPSRFTPEVLDSEVIVEEMDWMWELRLEMVTRPSPIPRELAIPRAA